MKHPNPRRATACGAGLTLMFMATLAQAQYKVVMPDGSVTYTDRPPITTNARITSMTRSGARSGPSDPGLPADLRAAVTRYPVTLYTSAECPACDSGRRLLQQRGVPYSERRVGTEDDAAALERLVGGRSVPSISIGAQPLRGFSETDWQTYLDVAGYPRENKLPRGWQIAEPTPLVDRSSPSARAPAAPAAAEPRPTEAAEPPTQPGSIRF